MQRPTVLPLSALGARLRSPEIAALMKAALETPGLLSLSAGFTDSASLPVEAVGRAVAALAAAPGATEHLQYGTCQGRPGLRRLLAERTSALDGRLCDDGAADRTIIGTGSQQLLCLACQVLCDQGDIVLVERPSYFVFLDMLVGLGVRAVSLPAREDGSFDLAAVAALLERIRAAGDAPRLKAAYLMSYFGNPSGFSRAEADKAALATALAGSGFIVPVLEDAAYRDLWFDAPWPARSILALREWEPFPKLFLGTLTKPYATGLKIGYAHASDATWLERMLWLKGHHDFGSANFNQAVLEQVIAQGGLDEQLERLRPIYAAKMRVLSATLEAEDLRAFGWTWREPAGGLYLWLQSPPRIDTTMGSPFWQACLASGVLYVPGGLCVADGDGSRFARLSFGVLGPTALCEAGRRFAAAVRRVGR